MSSGEHRGGAARREPGMWQQFRRRRVTRTVALYLLVAYFLVEAALFVAPLVELPSWAVRAVFGAVVLGFPFAVVLAWTYDVTPSGIVKTPEELGPDPQAPPSPGPRLAWAVFGAAALLGGLILRFLRA